MDVLSRGYRRQGGTAARVRPDGTAEEFGDEPLLIARKAGVPVYVASQRYEAGLMAEDDEPGDEDRPRVHILDDAFQHRQLHRDVDILLLDRDDWQDRLLPAGNLREPLHALKRASVIAIPDSDRELEGELRAWGWQGPLWRLRRHMEVPPMDGPVVAFCGIARPAQFFAGLEAPGLRLAARVVFRDHHRYTARDLDRLQGAARSCGAAALISTEKDLVRLERLSVSHAPALPLLSAGLRIEIEDAPAALDWLTRRLNDAKPRPSL